MKIERKILDLKSKLLMGSRTKCESFKNCSKLQSFFHQTNLEIYGNFPTLKTWQKTFHRKSLIISQTKERSNEFCIHNLIWSAGTANAISKLEEKVKTKKKNHIKHFKRLFFIFFSYQHCSGNGSKWLPMIRTYAHCFWKSPVNLFPYNWLTCLTF
jgi:hypothetical protein